MRSNNTRVARYLLCLVPAAVAFSYGSAPMSLAASSRLWVDGTSTVRSWTCKATTIDATIDAGVPNASAAVLQGEKVVTNVDVRIPTAKLDCGNGTMNEHMLKALKAKENPTIAFKVSGYDVAKGGAGVTGTLKGELTLGGQTRPITVTAAGSAGPDGTLHVTGTHEFAMTEFGIKPPSLMMGTMKVGPKVKVGFDLYLKN
jgi:polyisoprenoid-binding protein YceI